MSKSLRKIGFKPNEAFEIARKSCVCINGKRFTPYGFAQSMLLATVSLDCSSLGKYLRELRESGKFISMFVDDLIISGDCQDQLQETYSNLQVEILAAGFQLSESKSIRPTGELEVFNCWLGERKIEITDKRMDRFREQLKLASPNGREAILRYISVVNCDQVELLD